MGLKHSEAEDASMSEQGLSEKPTAEQIKTSEDWEGERGRAGPQLVPCCPHTKPTGYLATTSTATVINRTRDRVR